MSYKATPASWMRVEQKAEDCGNHASCLLELRDRVAALEQQQIAEPEKPCSLVSDVSTAIMQADNKFDLGPERWTPEALAAIEAVAYWLEQDDNKESGAWRGVAAILRQEVERG